MKILRDPPPSRIRILLRSRTALFSTVVLIFVLAALISKPLAYRIYRHFRHNSQSPAQFYTATDSSLQPGIALLPLPTHEIRADPQVSAEGWPIHDGGIELPRYQGVAQLHILTARSVIVVMDTLPFVMAQIDTWTKGDFSRSIRAWHASSESASPNWAARKAMMDFYGVHFARARQEIGEGRLGEPSWYKITSDDDPNYAGIGRSPLRAAPAWIGVDSGTRVSPGAGSVRYGVYAYLELPEPLQEGKTYRFTTQFATSAELRWSASKTISRAIKINQVGYRPGDPLKIAYLGGWIPGVGALDIADDATFDLVSIPSGKVIHSGRLILRDNISRCTSTTESPDTTKRPLITGEKVYQADFTACNLPGMYYLRIPGVGRSWAFSIAEDVYGEAFYTAMRGLFHQRGSFALELPYTAWVRPRLHTADIYESELIPFSIGILAAPESYQRFDVVGATTDLSKRRAAPSGGWYDAADYDRNASHYTIIYDLLWMFEQRPGVFTDNQLNIPESGNGIPDVLDEVEFGLSLWLQSQETSGGVSGWLETSTHPAYNDDRFLWSFSRRTRWSSLQFAAGAAWYARLVTPYSQAKADKYTAAAKAAWIFGCDPKNSLGTITINARKNRGTGEAYTQSWSESDSLSTPFKLLAASQLFLLSNDPVYLDNIATLAKESPKPFVWPYTLKDYSVWFSMALITSLRDRVPQALVKELSDPLVQQAEQLASIIDDMPYRQSWSKKRDFWMSWGATCQTNANRALFAALAIEPRAEWKRAVLANAAFAFGANPLGLSFTTGIGNVYPAVIQHEWSEKDGIDDPVPGLTVYGPTESTAYSELRNEVWSQQVLNTNGTATQLEFWVPPEWPIWRHFSPHPTLNTPQCEFTVHETVSSTILTCGMLMSSGWSPSKELMEKKPRSIERIFGYWYVP